MHKSLKYLNTFGVESSTPQLFIVEQLRDLDRLISEVFDHNKPYLILGAGSNMLLLEEAPPLVISVQLKGIDYSELDNDEVIVQVNAGENWHKLVEECLSKGYFGLENLALIPGLLGAAPVQNIGAYGVELSDVFISLEAVNLVNGEKNTFKKEECQFDYRNSFFKTPEGQKYLITSVTLKLSKKPSVNLSHNALKDIFTDCEFITPKMVFDKVCDIRSSKLPNPEDLGNAGSFFKNPVISVSEFNSIQAKYPDVISFELPDGQIKLAAGWMIDKAGLKGYRKGDAAVHTKQALVLVNHGTATGDQLCILAREIQDKIVDLFSVKLEPEVLIIAKSGAVKLEDVS